MPGQITKRKGPGRPPGSRNKRTLLAEAIQHGLDGFVKEEMPKVVKVVFEQALEGCRDSQRMLFKQFLVTQEGQARERLARATRVTASLPGGGKAEKLTDSTESGDGGVTITFSVVGTGEQGEVIDVEGERVEDD